MKIFWKYKETIKNKRPIPWGGMPIWADVGGWNFVAENKGDQAKVKGKIYYLGSYTGCHDGCFYLPGEPGAPEMPAAYKKTLLYKLSEYSHHMVRCNGGEWIHYTGPPNVQEVLFLPKIPDPFSVIYPYGDKHEQQVTKNPCNCGGPTKYVYIGISGSADIARVCSLCGKEK